MSNLTAIILAGGLGTRLRPVVSDKPKVLASIRGRPFIELLLEQIAAASITRAILGIGYLANQVQEHLGPKFQNLDIDYSVETKPLGTAGALRLAIDRAEGETVLVLNGDSFCDISVSAFIAWHINKQARCSIALARVSDISRYGAVMLDSEENIAGFSEKGASSGEGLVNAGIYLIHRSIIEPLPIGQEMSLEREVFPTLLGRGFCGWRTPHSLFLDIGTPESYQQAQTVLPSLSQSRE